MPYLRRINRTRIYMVNLLVYYYKVIQFDMKHLPITLVEALKKYNKTILLHGTKKLKEHLPKIDMSNFDINTLDHSKEFSNMLIHQLLTTLNKLQSYKHPDKNLKDITKVLAEWFSKYIIHTETMLSMYDEDQLRRDKSERHKIVLDTYNNMLNSGQNENLEIIEMYDPEFVKEHNLKEELKHDIADNSFEMTIDVDEENDITKSDD